MSSPDGEANTKTNHDKRIKPDLCAHTLLGISDWLAHEKAADRQSQPADEHQTTTPRRRNHVWKESKRKEQKPRESKPEPIPNLPKSQRRQGVWYSKGMSWVFHK